MNKTHVSNELALRQIVSVDGRRTVSVVNAGDGQFRFVEEAEIYQADTLSVAEYWYWTEAYRSGLYASAESAENEAVCTLPWLKAQITN